MSCFCKPVRRGVAVRKAAGKAVAVRCHCKLRAAASGSCGAIARTDRHFPSTIA